MIYCLSCQKYPMDSKVIPYGSTFPIDTYTVRLISDTLPSPLPSSGTDVENLADGTKFAVGSTLFVRSGSDGVVEQYVYIEGEFKVCNGIGGSSITIENLTIDEDGTVRIVY